jgi:hypothetical protein
VAIVQALIAALTRSAGKLLNTAFGWATVMLFGRVPQDRQIYLSMITLASVLWLVAVLGIAFPAFAAFLLAFVALPDWVDRQWIRWAMIALAVVVPGVVGLLSTRMLDEADRPRGVGPTVMTILKGYPYTFGLSITLIMMTIFAPVMKVRNMARRWTMQHVPVIVEAEDYPTVVGDLRTALAAGGMATTATPASWMLRVPTKVLGFFGRGAYGAMVARQLTTLHGDGFELILHPSDLVVSGTEKAAAHARAVLAEQLAFTRAYLTWDKEANEIEDRLRHLWEAAEHHAPIRPLLERLETVERDLRALEIPYEEWEVLFRETLVVERRLLRDRPSTWEIGAGRLVAAVIAAAPLLQTAVDAVRETSDEVKPAVRAAARPGDSTSAGRGRWRNLMRRFRRAA